MELLVRVKPIADSPLVSTLWEYFTFPLKGIDHTYMLTWLEHVSYDCRPSVSCSSSRTSEVGSRFKTI
ncbi:unnamed protein product, partial [Prunus brigantina]